MTNTKKEERKLVSLADLIKDKVKYKQDDNKVMSRDLYVPRLGGDIKLSFTKTDAREFIEISNDEGSTTEQIQAAGYNLIYSIVTEPNLKDKSIQEEYECEVPTDIVPKVFNDGEQFDIADFVIKDSGFHRGVISVVEDLKN